ncbi:acetyl-CoA carboxylase, carboxyltransferase subunit beta [Estrella lausannensis]|uniref:Acetyl-coenzyme A carboxylase carboxyl transferase subunit beta n=1 Tax=Estrella lausannensis TaxID=483423 RepID=A0A0H5DQ28_9BACT|nr:acetyl-CoA carboxylase, carboxyltransferase subunit beta [Estrella lausannensis]CRX37624.1 acetyl-CoA carboxylase subunit beta [Estrella lausannensis]
MGLFSRSKPKIKIQTTKKDGYSGWLKCVDCNEMIHANELSKNYSVCPKCGYHYRLSAEERIALLSDEGTFELMFDDIRSEDPLTFQDTEPYGERLTKAMENTGRTEAVLVGPCLIGGQKAALGVMDFNFMGGSMGSVVGERLTLLIEYAIKKKLPVVIVSTSGGARMQESIFSLMQMAKTSAALAKLEEVGLPFISILTNPTTGGVTASFASLGDIIIAEPKALICFAGPRVIEQTIGQKLPEGAQKSEFLLNHGMIDCIVKRHDLKDTVSEMLELLVNKQK